MTGQGTHQTVGDQGPPPSKPAPPTKPIPSGGKHDLRLLVAQRLLEAKRDAAVVVGGYLPSDDTRIKLTPEYQHALYLCNALTDTFRTSMEIRNGWRHENNPGS